MNYRQCTEQPFVRRVGQLTTKLLRENIRDSEWQELQALLKGNAKARRAYVESMMLRAELHYARRTINKEQPI
jgi:hypothetical protein